MRCCAVWRNAAGGQRVISTAPIGNRHPEELVALRDAGLRPAPQGDGLQGASLGLLVQCRHRRPRMAPFDPVSALVGGALIGLAAVLLMLLNGRIAGVSGILGGALTGDGRAWRLAFLAG